MLGPGCDIKCGTGIYRSSVLSLMYACPGLSWNPQNGDQMFIPYAMGSVSDCGRKDVGPCPQWSPAGAPGGDSSFPEIQVAL